MNLDLVSQARTKRESIAVLLAKYMTCRARRPESVFVVLEGNDDLGVWPTWFSRCGLTEGFETFPCRGKERVLELRERLQGSLAFDPGRRLFFVDRDFDNLDFFSGKTDIFVTQRYSIENYFLPKRVLEHILDASMGCAGYIGERDRIVDLYLSSLKDFIAASREINFRAFCLRRTYTEGPRAGLPDKLQDFVKISDGFLIEPHDRGAESIVPIPHEIPKETLELLRAEFDSFDPLCRYRGKFFRAFLIQFLTVLQNDRNSDARKFFSEGLPKVKLRYLGLHLPGLAAFSDLPEGIRSFLCAHSLVENN